VALLAGGLFVYAALAVSSMLTTSAVYDETAHLPAGYTYLTLRDFRMNPEHPPLVKELAALPLLLMDVRMRTALPAWALGQEWEFGHRFLYQWNDADHLLFWGRLPVVALGCALGAAVLLWTRRRFGPVAGAIAFFLCLLSPDVLAHGQIVTTDLAVALFLFLSVIAFHSVTERVTVSRVVLAGLAAGAALASKFSALVLVPILVALAAVVALSSRPLTAARYRAAPREITGVAARLAMLALVLCAIGAIALLFVWATYAFHPRLANDADAAASLSWSRLDRPGAARAGPSRRPRPRHPARCLRVRPRHRPPRHRRTPGVPLRPHLGAGLVVLLPRHVRPEDSGGTPRAARAPPVRAARQGRAPAKGRGSSSGCRWRSTWRQR
jgi:hypothetical protein